MSKVVYVCPYLGLPFDPESHYSEPDDVHRCYSPKQPGDIALDYQAAFCLSSQYRTCSRFVSIPKVEAPAGVDGSVGQAAAEGASAGQVLPKAKPIKRQPWWSGTRVQIALGVAGFLVIIAIYFLVVVFAPKEPRTGLVLPNSLPTRTSTPTLTPTSRLTRTPNPVPPPTTSLLTFPTTSSNSTLLSFVPDADGVGWVSSNDLSPHWGDRYLHAGTFQKQTYTSIIRFVSGNALPPGSKILFAVLELTGRNASRLGEEGEWQLELLDSSQSIDWLQATTGEVLSVPSVSPIARRLPPSELRVNGLNQFQFTDEQLRLLEQQLKYGRLAFRIKGPASDQDNLFSWDSGTASIGGLGAPTLYLVAVPGPLTIITNTPTPANVLTAAADVIRATALALQFGTPTPFGPGVVTPTPGGNRIEVTPVNTPANAATIVAQNELATAIAVTTGTYTPTPKNFVVVFPTLTPFFIPLGQLLVPPTPTPLIGVDYTSVPIPSFLAGKILVYSTRFGDKFAQLPIVMSPDGSVSGILSGDLYYQAAYARETYSPDRRSRAIVTSSKDRPDVLQIWIQDVKTGDLTPVTHLGRGLAYDPAWSPDGASIAYVSTESGSAEILVYNVASQTSRQLTFTTRALVYNQRPSWSLDSKQLVFKSNREGAYFQIWMMNADGSNLKNISRTSYDEADPVWVKP
jgi:hypothetical protein